MSAEKCGGALTFGMIQEAAEKVAKQGMELPLKIVSYKAYRMLKKIHHKYPNFDPSTEAEIWYKAYTMGLTEDE